MSPAPEPRPPWALVFQLPLSWSTALGQEGRETRSQAGWRGRVECTGRGVCDREPAGSRAGFVLCRALPGGFRAPLAPVDGAVQAFSGGHQPSLGSARTVTQTPPGDSRLALDIGLDSLAGAGGSPGPCAKVQMPPLCSSRAGLWRGRAWDRQGRPQSSRGEGWLRARGFPVESELPLIRSSLPPLPSVNAKTPRGSVSGRTLPMETPPPLLEPRGLSGLLRLGRSSPRCPGLLAPPSPAEGSPAQGRVWLCQAVRLPLLPLTPGPWALLRVGSVIRAGSVYLRFPPTSLSSCLCENESYCLFQRVICLMPLEFICWSIFHSHIRFRPWAQPRGYITWDGTSRIGIWEAPQCTPPSPFL